MTRSRHLPERKAALIEESARARRLLQAQISPAVLRETALARLLGSAGALLREPLVLGTAVIGMAAFGPRRLIRLVRWTVITLPLHPLGRRLIPLLGARLLAMLTAAPGALRR